MATNVTEKDKTLHEIIAYCEKKMTDIGHDIDIIEDHLDVSDEVYSQLQGKIDAYEDVALKCINLVGHMKEDDTNGD
jgi:hypothetical protein